MINLDAKPKTWEDRTTLFIGYKIDQGITSTTVKSYVSAIKKILVDDGYPWDDQKVLLGTLTRACKLVNDRVCTRLPIQCSLLEIILFELERIFNRSGQYYIQLLYKTLFALAYYGLMRVGEVTLSDHVVKAKDVHAGRNKDNLLIILYSSKTHNQGMRPQKIKIISNRNERSGQYVKRHFCPFQLTNEYFELRGGFDTDEEQFFIFRDRTPVSPCHARKVLKDVLQNLGLEHENYGMHSFRVGRASDLIKYHYTIEEVKKMGRWRSNAVYRYIRS